MSARAPKASKKCHAGRMASSSSSHDWFSKSRAGTAISRISSRLDSASHVTVMAMVHIAFSIHHRPVVGMPPYKEQHAKCAKAKVAAKSRARLERPTRETNANEQHRTDDIAKETMATMPGDVSNDSAR